MRDRLGGAEKIAWNLTRACRKRGHTCWMAVGQKRTGDPDVFVIPNDRAAGRWRRFWWGVHHGLQPTYGRFPGSRLLCRLAHRLAEPGGLLDRYRGIEDFRYPGTWRLLKVTPEPPDIIHCHNLHSNFFDLRALPWLSRQVPVVVTCHDTWLLSGHCAYSLGCDRWKTGCGACPDLTIHPAVKRDATDLNWQRKRDIFATSKLYVASSSRWVMEQVQQSMLAPAVVESRVIPNGIDLSVFKPAQRRAVRAALGIPHDVKMLVFSANGIRANVFKDYQTMRSALARLGQRLTGQRIILIALGEDAPPEHIGGAEIRFIPFEPDQAVMARYYQAADVYIHAARGEAWGLTITEALACGTPVVATAVGGIPDQIKPLAVGPDNGGGVSQTTGADDATGILVPMGDAEAMAAAVDRLLRDAGLCRRMGENAALDVRARFGLGRQADAYLDWFAQILKRRAEQRGAHAAGGSFGIANDLRHPPAELVANR